MMYKRDVKSKPRREILPRTAHGSCPSTEQQHDWVSITVCLFFWVMFFWILAKILCLCYTMLWGMAGGGRHATPPAWCERVLANQRPTDRGPSCFLPGVEGGTLTRVPGELGEGEGSQGVVQLCKASSWECGHRDRDRESWPLSPWILCCIPVEGEGSPCSSS